MVFPIWCQKTKPNQTLKHYSWLLKNIKWPLSFFSSLILTYISFCHLDHCDYSSQPNAQVWLCVTHPFAPHFSYLPVLPPYLCSSCKPVSKQLLTTVHQELPNSRGIEWLNLAQAFRAQGLWAGPCTMMSLCVIHDMVALVAARRLIPPPIASPIVPPALVISPRHCCCCCPSRLCCDPPHHHCAVSIIVLLISHTMSSCSWSWERVVCCHDVAALAWGHLASVSHHQ